MSSSTSVGSSLSSVSHRTSRGSDDSEVTLRRNHSRPCDSDSPRRSTRPSVNSSTVVPGGIASSWSWRAVRRQDPQQQVGVAVEQLHRAVGPDDERGQVARARPRHRRSPRRRCARAPTPPSPGRRRAGRASRGRAR